MPGSKSYYASKQILDSRIGGVSYTPPSTLYCALFTVAPTDAGGGTEVSGNAYARVAVTNNLTNFPAATGTTVATKTNGTAVTFPVAAPAGWGTVVAVGWFDASTAGNLLDWATLAVSKLVGAGDQPSFAATKLTFTED